MKKIITILSFLLAIFLTACTPQVTVKGVTKKTPAAPPAAKYFEVSYIGNKYNYLTDFTLLDDQTTSMQDVVTNGFSDMYPFYPTNALRFPVGSAYDSSDGNIYITERDASRIVRYSTITKSFTGWIGVIGVLPTGGDPGCATAKLGEVTPGWCTGGAAIISASDGGFNTPHAIMLSGNYLYVADSANWKIARINKNTGMPEGWIGILGAHATGGVNASACTSANIGSPTPGWCSGGSSINFFSGTFPAEYIMPRDILISGNNLYVSSASSGDKINRYNLTTGVFTGWIGKAGPLAADKPTGDGAGNPVPGSCVGIANGAVVPGWCMGGKTQAGTNTGAFSSIRAMTSDGTYLYAVETNNHRISRANLVTGAPAGWIGRILSTTGLSGCTATVGAFSSNWCTGGTSQNGTATDGSLYQPVAINYDSVNQYLIVADLINRKLTRYQASNGNFKGWIGTVGSVSPTNDASGSGVTTCSQALMGQRTPGWCMGGSSITGSVNGFNYPSNIISYGTGEYIIPDGGAGVLHKINIQSGTHLGVMGAVTSFTEQFSPLQNQTMHVNSVENVGLANPYGITSDGNYLYVASQANNSIQRYTLDGAPAGWIGKIKTPPLGGDSGCIGALVNSITPGWCIGGSSQNGSGTDGSFNAPYGVHVKNDILYVTNSSTSTPTVERFQASTGEFLGWIGRVNSVTGLSPVVTTGSATDGWSEGGTTQAGTGNGHFSTVRGISSDDNYLYIGDNGTSGRVVRVNIDSGVFAGWIGEVLTSPTSPAVCASAVEGDITPDWCMGGTSKISYNLGGYGPLALDLKVDGKYLYVTNEASFRVTRLDKDSGTMIESIGLKHGNTPMTGWRTDSVYVGQVSGEGGFLGANSVAYDGHYIYVGQNGNIARFVYSTGAPAGWIGEVDVSPTGGDAGCIGALKGTITPGWCTGGVRRSGTQYGAYSGVPRVIYEGGSLYIADRDNSRIIRVNPTTGLVTGWVGRISATASEKPTGEGSGNPTGASCTGAAVSTATTGWCVGGKSQSGPGDGMLSSSSGLHSDGVNIYVADGSNNRIQKFNLVTGAFGGWIGNVATLPTGGETGCTTTAIGDVTPGWCVGGTASYAGRLETLIASSRVITTDATYVYSVSSMHDKVLRFNKSNGSYQGWIGRVGEVPTSGDSGCTSAVVSQFTPGWCIGGRSMSLGEGTLKTTTEVLSQTFSDKGMWSPNGILVNAGVMYIASSDGKKLGRYIASTGQFTGWVGAISIKPTGGAPGCSSAALESLTPGWCTGGAAWSYGKSGHFTASTSAIVIGGDLIIPNGATISKFNLTSGAFTGWLGGELKTDMDWKWASDSNTRIYGDSATSPVYTRATGSITGPRGIETDDNYVYIAENPPASRVTRWDKKTGSYAGWFGHLKTYNQCAYSQTNLMTKTWCYEGESVKDAYKGMFYPSGLYKHDDYLYITDINNKIVMRVQINN